MFFKRKGYGRIYSDSDENIAKIHELIRAMDAFEFDYLPDALIAVYTGFDEPVYVGKFCALDLTELQKRCNSVGIPCRIVIAEEGADA
ncbi:MAG: hypothetical protein LBN00_03610 [Oscillospiraceae bacterium]|nr:hypothetical protein [Oscillospiraceae bacterium]